MQDRQDAERTLEMPIVGKGNYKQAKENGWFAEDTDLLTEDGTQIAPLNYPHLSHTEIFKSVEDLQEILLPPVEDRLDRRRDDHVARNDEAAPAGRHRILPLPARAPKCRLNRQCLGNDQVEASCRGGPMRIG